MRKKTDNARTDVGYGYSIANYPIELRKKVQLLLHFKTFLEKQSKQPRLVKLAQISLV